MSTSPNSHFDFRYLLSVALVTAMGGLLFGYDWVVIGGAKPFYEEYFHLRSSFQIGWAMSNALVGCLLGAALSGWLADRFGRKRILIVAGLLFTLSAVGTALATSFTAFVWARILGGVGIGLASSVSPMYIAEIAPARHRGRLVSINQFTIVVGILAAQVANWLIADPVPAGTTSAEILNSWNGQYGWRWMFGAEALPAFVFFALAFLLPESPRWLVKQERSAEAGVTLTKIGGAIHAQRELQDIEQTLLHERGKVHFRELVHPTLFPIVLIGVALAVFQQWSGINVIFNYADEIFTSAGYSVGDMLFNIVITGSVNLVFTIVAIYTVDSWGRKKLMLMGSGGLAVIYLFIAFFYYNGILGAHLLFLVIAAIAIYAMSLAPVTWVLISEIFPNRIRGAAMSVAVVALWAACLVLTYTFPLLNSSFGEGAKGTALAFGVYAVICLVGFFFILKKLPETKGRSLEELERELTGPKAEGHRRASEAPVSSK